MDALLVGLLGVVVTGFSALWWRVGRVESAVKKSCPFGTCPFYNRAIKEVAPPRQAGE